MKVLYLNHTSQISGAEHALLALLKRLPDDIEPAVACAEGPLAREVRELGIPVMPVGGTSGSLRLHPVYTPRAVADVAASAFILTRLARRFGADLVHANSIRAGVIGVIGRRIGVPPVAVHLHDNLPPGLLSSASLRVISHADGMLACSEYVLGQLSAAPRPHVVRVVHNPVDTARFDPDRIDRGTARAALGLDPGRVALGMVAQVTPWKGQDDAVRMLSLLRREHPEVRLLLVGSPKFVGRGTRYDNVAYARSLDELIRSQRLEDEVIQLGERQDIPEILRAVDVFLAPSWEEPFPLAVIEAMAMRLPIVGTVYGGLPEIVNNENGILLPPRDPDRWAEAVGRLIDEPARREAMGTRARESVARELDAPRWAGSVTRTYEEVLDAVRERKHPVRPRIPRRAPLRILYVNHTSQVSGGERSLLTLLGGLNPSIRPVVACPEGQLAEEVRALGVEIVPLHGMEGSLKLHPYQTPVALWALLRDAVEIRRAARAINADVIHANSIRAGLSTGLAARIWGPPAVVHVRDRLPDSPVSSLTFQALAHTADHFVSNSGYTAAGIPTNHSGARVGVIHNCVDLSRFNPDRLSREEARERLGLGPEQPVLGIVAQISPWKAQDDAIRIAAELAGSYPDIRLLIVGSAKFVSKATRFDNMRYLAELEALTQSLGVEDNVLFMGEREDIPEILRSLDVLLMPSWFEPFGRAIIEAMAMGVTVVATKVGGPREIVADAEEGLLLPPRDPARWAEAVAALLEDPERRQEMGRNARKRATREFSVERHIARVEALYDELLSRLVDGDATR
jgi:glycosyltransferase involved in cell wall biosynthesis